jgi:PAS domain S-box-containing protein
VSLADTSALRRELEEQLAILADESARYAAFFEHAPDAYAITDGAGTIREANRAFLALLEPLRGAVAGRALSECIGAHLTASSRRIALKDGGGGLCWLVERKT